MFRRCPFCHRWIFGPFYAAHERNHTRRRADGQMTDHVTAPPKARYDGPLDDVPRAYHHAACGVATGMPEEIIRTYLVAPLTYGDGSFCCGCGTYVDSADLVWTETGENVVDYMGRLRLKYLRSSLGMTVADRPDGIVITPRAGKFLAEILRDLGPSAVVSVGLPGPGSTDYKLDAAVKYDGRTEALLKVSGIRVAVVKEDVGRVAGIVIDYTTAPQRGLSVGRLYAPDGAPRAGA